MFRGTAQQKKEERIAVLLRIRSALFRTFQLMYLKIESGLVKMPLQEPLNFPQRHFLISVLSCSTENPYMPELERVIILEVLLKNGNMDDCIGLLSRKNMEAGNCMFGRWLLCHCRRYLAPIKNTGGSRYFLLVNPLSAVRQAGVLMRLSQPCCRQVPLPCRQVPPYCRQGGP